MIPRNYLRGLRPCRKAAGLTQADLARAVRTSRQNIQKWESGDCWPSAAWIPKLADVCQCRMEALYEEHPEGGETG